jgi:hypothetical protein
MLLLPLCGEKFPFDDVNSGEHALRLYPRAASREGSGDLLSEQLRGFYEVPHR